MCSAKSAVQLLGHIDSRQLNPDAVHPLQELLAALSELDPALGSEAACLEAAQACLRHRDQTTQSQASANALLLRH